MALSFRQEGKAVTDAARTLAWAYLSRVAEPPCDEIATLVGDVGLVDTAHRVAAGEVSDALRKRTAARRDINAAEADLVCCGGAEAA